MTSELRQRKNATGSGATNSGPSTFSQRAQADQRQRQVDAAAEAELKKKRPSVVGRFLLFIGLPTFMGFLGMVTSYGRNVAEGKKDISLINFDQDFFFPFMRKSEQKRKYHCILYRHSCCVRSRNCV